MFLNCDVFLSLKVVLMLANSADPDEMQLYAVFHLVFTVCQSTHLGVSSKGLTDVPNNCTAQCPFHLHVLVLL